MLNTYQLRKKRLAGIFNNNEYFCTCSICEEKIENKYWPSAIALIVPIIACTVLILIASCAHPKIAHADNAYTDKEAIMAIIGEAENQGFDGMLAVACAIRNRGTLKGVYGLHAKRVLMHSYSQNTLELAISAYNYSKTHDITHGATGWGNKSDIALFKHHAWFKHCIITAHIGDHFFYRKA